MSFNLVRLATGDGGYNPISDSNGKWLVFRVWRHYCWYIQVSPLESSVVCLRIIRHRAICSPFRADVTQLEIANLPIFPASCWVRCFLSCQSKHRIPNNSNQDGTFPNNLCSFAQPWRRLGLCPCQPCCTQADQVCM